MPSRTNPRSTSRRLPSRRSHESWGCDDYECPRSRCDFTRDSRSSDRLCETLRVSGFYAILAIARCWKSVRIPSSPVAMRSVVPVREGAPDVALSVCSASGNPVAHGNQLPEQLCQPPGNYHFQHPFRCALLADVWGWKSDDGRMLRRDHGSTGAVPTIKHGSTLADVSTAHKCWSATG